MLIKQKKPFAIGVILLLSFTSIFYFLLKPVFTVDSDKLTGLQFADRVFNELSKGSSDFFQLTTATAQNMANREISVSYRLDNITDLEVVKYILAKSGATEIDFENGRLSFEANLGKLLTNAIGTSKLLYENAVEKVSQSYNNLAPLVIARGWWHLLNPCIKELEKQGKVGEAKAVETIVRRAVEPANNFYGIPAKKVSGNVPMLSAFLLFYIIYTIWYGFAIYEIFVGLGLMNIEVNEEEIKAECNE